MDERLEFLYNSMVEAGHDMGGIEDFAQSLSGIEAQRFVFDNLKDAHDLGDFNSFQTNLAESYKGQGFSSVPNVGFVPTVEKENKIPTEQSATARVYKQAIADRGLGFDLDTVINDEGETWRDHMDQAAKNNALPDFLDRIGAGQALPQETQAIHQAIADDPRTSLEVAREESPTFKVLDQLRVQPAQEEEFQADVNDLFESVYDKGMLGKLSESFLAFNSQTLLNIVDFTKSRAENAIEDLEEKYELVLNDEFRDGLATSLANEFDQQRGGASLAGNLAGFVLPAGLTIKGVQKGLRLALPNSKFAQLFQAGSGGQVAGFTRNALETLPADILDAYNVATDREGNFNMGQFYLQIAADMGLGGIIGTSLEGIFKSKIRNADFSKEGEFERIKSEMEGEAQQIKNIEEGTDVGELKTEKLPEQETITETISPEQTAKLEAVPEPAKVSTEVSESGNVVVKDTDDSFNTSGERGSEAPVSVATGGKIKQFINDIRFGVFKEQKTSVEIEKAAELDTEVRVNDLADTKKVSPGEMDSVIDLITKDKTGRKLTHEQNQQLEIYLKELDNDPKARNEFTFEQLKGNKKILKKIANINKTRFSKLAKARADFVGIVSDQLGSINKSLKFAVRNVEFTMNEATNRSVKIITPFLEKYRKLDPDKQRQLWFALSNAKNTDKLAKEFELFDELAQVKGLLEETRVAVGEATDKEIPFIENFFPRKVENLEELVRTQGFDTDDVVQRALKRQAEKQGKGVGDLTDVERSSVIKNVLESNFADVGGRGGDKSRKIREVSESQRLNYANLDKALVNYLENNNRQIIMGKTFDVTSDVTGDINFNSYVESIVGKEITSKESKRVLELLKSWGNPKTGSAFEETIATIQYLDYLTQYGAYIRQLGDVASSAFRYGIAATGKGLVKGIRASATEQFNKLLPEGLKLDKKFIALVDIELDKIAEEVVNKSVGDLQQKILKGGLKAFQLADRMGKNVLLNSSFDYFKSTAKKNPKKASFKRLKDDLTRMFRDPKRVEKILDDLRNKEGFDAVDNRDVKILLWNELADVQPISRAEHSKGYLEAQGFAKTFYRFKTFSLRRGNMIWRFINDPRIGKVEKAKRVAKALSYYTAIEGSVDILIDLANGKEPDPANSFLNGFLGLALLNTYDAVNAKRDGIPEALFEKIMPSLTIGKDLTKLGFGIAKDGLDADFTKLIKHIPGIGRGTFEMFFADDKKEKPRRR